MNENLIVLAELLDVFVEAQDRFLAEHAQDFDSGACQAAYDKEQDAINELQHEWRAVLRHSPRILSAALRQSK